MESVFLSFLEKKIILFFIYYTALLSLPLKILAVFASVAVIFANAY